VSGDVVTEGIAASGGDDQRAADTDDEAILRVEGNSV
jgi:hypothetical protein